MPSLIIDKDTAKEFVRINFINDVSSLPDFELAADRYLVPIIGPALYDDLAADLGAADEVLLKKCRAVIAPLGYLMELATIQTQLTDSGLKTVNTEAMQAAHRWEYNEVKDHLADKGSFAIEALLKHLFAENPQNVLWTGSEEYKEVASLLFRSAEEFNRYFRVHQPYRVFWELRPVIREVEDLYINSTIGEVFFKELKEAADPGTEEKEAIKLLKKAIAQFTILKAIEKLSVIKTEKGFTVQLSAGNSDADNAGDQPARDNQLSLLYSSCEKDGNAYLLQLQEYLNEKASAVLFTTYKDSKYYTAPSTTEEESKNANRKIFGF